MPRKTAKSLLLKSVLESIDPEDCALCRRPIRKRKDRLLYGPAETTNRFSVHYFCLLFASNLVQKGTEDEGIKGFLHQDIIDEVVRGRHLLCSCCRKSGATIGCVVEKCRRVVHFPCGLESNMTFDFASSSFETFCRDHSPFPRDPPPDRNSVCSICLTNFDRMQKHKYRPITCPKCQNCFHINCLRKTALKSGIHHYRCPFCRDEETFVAHCQRNGIYVPDQDAAWELEDAFNDHYEVLLKCHAFECLCPGGRKVDNAHWDITSCSTCGLNATHARCRNLGEDGIYICSDCTPMPPKPQAGQPQCNATEWFYSKSSFHFLEPDEVIQTLKKTDEDEDIDIESDSTESDAQALRSEKSLGSPQESVWDLVLEESNDPQPKGDELRLPSPSKWNDFKVLISGKECENISQHLPCLPTRLQERLQETMDCEPSSSALKRFPFPPIHENFLEAPDGASKLNASLVRDPDKGDSADRTLKQEQDSNFEYMSLA
ncbi:PHD finger protein 7 [Galendromus occidentalis]|uniref:PHD finger protein 7 n=1 Tax=Galendromus occidentalis TaxID=34638 RepID=A0AAJ6QW43_9ACAR|nr:PHD finger protein 7 [Galendromus occidentalis]